MLLRQYEQYGEEKILTKGVSLWEMGPGKVTKGQHTCILPLLEDSFRK